MVKPRTMGTSVARGQRVSSNQRINFITMISSRSLQKLPFHPELQTQDPRTHCPCWLQSGTWQSPRGTSHSAPFHPSSQWHTPPPYWPWAEHNTGQTLLLQSAPCEEKRSKVKRVRLLTEVIYAPDNRLCSRIFQGSRNPGLNSRSDTSWRRLRLPSRPRWPCGVEVRRCRLRGTSDRCPGTGEEWHLPA